MLLQLKADFCLGTAVTRKVMEGVRSWIISFHAYGLYVTGCCMPEQEQKSYNVSAKGLSPHFPFSGRTE